MKVAFADGASKKGDAVRGIGVHNSELLKNLDKISDGNTYSQGLNLNDNFSDYDVVHFTSFRPFSVSLPRNKPKNTKFVLTIHDLIPLIYPKVYKSGFKGALNYQINKFLIKKNIDAIITISETSKKDICRFLSVDPKIVNVVYLGAKDSYKVVKNKKELSNVSNKYGLPPKFIFYFGDINYNKNIGTLVDACNSLNIKLVIAGKQALEVENMDFNHPELEHLRNIDFSKTIRLGFISDSEANAILNMASCLVQPSYYEGFGLSVIHAFAAGCPVIASKTQALVEIGGNACIYFDPKSKNDLIEKMKSLIQDKEKQNKLKKLGFERLKKYSWEKTAKETSKVYAKVR